MTLALDISVDAKWIKQSPDRVRFFIPGSIVPWARAGRKGGFSYTPKEQKNFGAELRQFAYVAMNGAPLLECPVWLRVVATYPWPRNTVKKRQTAADGAWKATRPDIDNACIKLVADCLNGIVWRDDAQIAAVTAFKLLGLTPGLDVTITPLVGVAPSELGA
jgi:Holliday junction resolvase RusA-like endonuclease